MIRIVSTSLFILLISYCTVYAQKDTWVEINTGFAKCAEIGQSAGVATWERDDFKVNKLIHLRGEMYALIHYGPNGVNTSGCADGFFRHDTLSNNWIKVAENPHPSIGAIISNGTSIYTLADGWIYEFTTDYATYPTGWKSLTPTNLKYQDIFNNSCKGNGANGYHFQEPADAIGDTIYTFMQSDVKGCWNSNVMGKFSTVSGEWTYDRVGPLPHQMANASDIQDYRIAFADRIGGIFQYFITYGRWGQEKCLPNYLYVWDPRVKEWRNVSKGVNWRNMTGNSNPEGCVDPKRPIINWGPNGGWTPSWDRRDIYASSETGVYRWEGDKFYYIADYWGNAGIYPTANGIFTLVLGEMYKLNPTTNVPVGKLFDYGCIHNAPRMLTTPDNGNTLYVVKEGMKDPQICDWKTSRSAVLSINRLKFDPDKPAKARNLHVETATYIGGVGDNAPVGTGVAGNHHVFVAGNFSKVRSPKPFVIKNFNGANTNSRGRVIHMNTFGDTIISVTNLGNIVYDYEVQNFGKYKMVVSGDFGISVLDSSSMNQLWNIPALSLWGSGEINVDIDDNGHVVVLRSKQFKVFDANGVSISELITLNDDFVNDITIRNDKVYVVGFNNGTLDGDDCAGDLDGSKLPVQSAFVKAYAPTISSDTIFTTFGFKGKLLGKDEADTRGYRINIGKDGKIYFLGEAAGGNSVFRWNGKQTIAKNNCKNPKSKLVSYDLYSSPVNTKDAHIAFFCTINPTTGEVERGQYVIPRLPAGISNSYRIKDGYIHADQKGYVYIGATSAYAFGGRDIQHLNGILVGDYVGGDMVALVVNPDYSIRTFWGTFSKTAGSGIIKGFGIRDNIISAVGETGNGIMITGGTINGSFEKKNAINPDPFNLDMTGDNPLNDTYVAVWYQDVWRQAPKDTLEERKNPSEPVIDEEALNYRANFEASVTTACVGGDVTFTNKSIGDSLNWIWNFGEGSSLPVNTFGKGPFTLQYTTPGLKTIRLDVLLKSNVKDYHQKYNYINVIPADLTLSSIQGAALVCTGTKAIYRVEPVFGIEAYVWTVPDGSLILQGQGSASIEVSWGATAGDITVSAKTPCGTTLPQTLTVDLLTVTGEQSVILVVGNETLDAGDLLIKNKIESIPPGYTVTPILDKNINEAHGRCATLIVVSASADAALINYKLLNAPVPIISYLGSLFDKLGMTNPTENFNWGAQTGATKLNVIDNTHQLGEELPSGEVSVYTTGHAVNWGKPAPAGIKIASVFGDNDKISIIGYEQGSAMFGLAAPARRVGFYLSQDGLLDLTSDGVKLLDRAICWALYNCPADVSIETGILAADTYCPGGEIEVPFIIEGIFKAGTIIPPPQTIAMDDTSEGVAIFGQWIKTGGYREHLKVIGDARYAKYNPTLPYAGLYKVTLNFPRSALYASNTMVIITHAGVRDTVFVNQKSAAPVVLGPYSFNEGKDGHVMITTTNANGTIVTDEVIFESTELTPLGGNVFTAQLSNREGNFTAPVVLGTLAGILEGSIPGIIPENTLPGSKYKVRVVSSNPSFKGTVSTDITINGTPPDPIKINGETLACSGSSIQSYSIDQVPGATSYIWEIPLGTHFNIPALPNETTITTTDLSVTIDFGTATSNNILVYANNACGKSENPARLLVEMTGNPPAKPSAIVGKTIICPDATGESYSVSPVQYASSYSWTRSSGATITSTTNAIVIDFETADETLSVKAIGACGDGETVTLDVIVNQDCDAAVADFITALTTCTDSAVMFTDNSVGATSWTWNFGAGANPQSISGFEPAKTPPPIFYSTQGEKIVKLIINDGTAFKQEIEKKIQVYPKPKLPEIIQSTGNAIACGTGGVANYSVPIISNANTYVWRLPADAVAIDNPTPNSINVNLATAQSGFVSVAGKNNCGEGPKSSYFIQINNLTDKPDSIAGPIKVCAGATNIVYEVTPVKDAVSYTWETSSGITIIGDATTNKITVNFTSAGAKTIIVKANNGCTESEAAELEVEIGVAAADLTTQIVGPELICAGATKIGYNIEAVNGATGYNWELPNGSSGASTTNTIEVNFANALSGNISVSAVLDCGVTSALVKPVVVEEGTSTPPVFSEGPIRVCANQLNVVYKVNPEVETYQWTLPEGVAGNSASNSITVNFGNTGGDISVSGVYACGVGVPATISVSQFEGTPVLGAVKGNLIICPEGISETYSIVKPVEGVSKYIWFLPHGALGSSTSATINVDFTNAESGYIEVKGETGCATVTTETKLPITILGTGTKATLSGTDTVCPDAEYEYNITGISNALFYTWILPESASGNTTTNLPSNMVSYGEDVLPSEIVAFANMTCGDPVKAVLPIDVSEKPGIPGTISGNDYICKDSQSEYTIEPVDNALAYKWTLPVGAVSSGLTNSNTITLNVKHELSGELCVTAVGLCDIESKPASCISLSLNNEAKGLCEIFIPNAFSPNGDGVNEVWQISGLGKYKRISIKVFNRWGNVVYDKTSYDSPWDGTFNGKKLSTATYYYVIVLDKEEPRKGSVSIIRDNE